MHQFATQYYDLRPAATAGTLTVAFAGNRYVGIVDNTPYDGASAEWWSNSGDNSVTTLTRAFDLTSLVGKPVTLRFQAWYSLEAGGDVTYIEVSTDGGVNWDEVQIAGPTASQGASTGITGVSGASQTDAFCGPQPQWVPMTADLSAFAGRRIMLRFRTSTNNVVHCPGLTLDDISIPALGFSDDVSTDNGWQAQGYIRSNNVLPERYFVQAIVYSSSGAVTVQRLSVDPASGAGRLSLPGFGSGVSRVVLAVSATAPATVVPAPYSLSAQVS